jgi:rhodanese-related sulfurtransferase
MTTHPWSTGAEQATPPHRAAQAQPNQRADAEQDPQNATHQLASYQEVDYCAPRAVPGPGSIGGCGVRYPAQPARHNLNINTKKQDIEPMKRLVTLLAAVLFTAAIHAGEVPDISIDALNKAIADKKVTVIDVNGTEAYKKGHIPGAIDFEAQKSKLAQVLPKDKNALVVAYCGGPQCTAYQSAAKAAKDLGYTNVKHLSAGISGWKEAGQKVESKS